MTVTEFLAVTGITATTGALVTSGMVNILNLVDQVIPAKVAACATEQLAILGTTPDKVAEEWIAGKVNEQHWAAIERCARDWIDGGTRKFLTDRAAGTP